jgi:hypothetical protein
MSVTKRKLWPQFSLRHSTQHAFPRSQSWFSKLKGDLSGREAWDRILRTWTHSEDIRLAIWFANLFNVQEATNKYASLWRPEDQQHHREPKQESVTCV